MKKLTISPKTFTEMLLGLIVSGVTFESEEDDNGNIIIIFLGGY